MGEAPKETKAVPQNYQEKKEDKSPGKTQDKNQDLMNMLADMDI